MPRSAAALASTMGTVARRRAAGPRSAVRKLSARMASPPTTSRTSPDGGASVNNCASSRGARPAPVCRRGHDRAEYSRDEPDGLAYCGAGKREQKPTGHTSNAA